jgi:hypothetical protein
MTKYPKTPDTNLLEGPFFADGTKNIAILSTRNETVMAQYPIRIAFLHLPDAMDAVRNLIP